MGHIFIVGALVCVLLMIVLAMINIAFDIDLMKWVTIMFMSSMMFIMLAIGFFTLNMI